MLGHLEWAERQSVPSGAIAFIPASTYISLPHIAVTTPPSKPGHDRNREDAMKDSANHPHYMPSKITCACGNVHQTFSTKADFSIDICSACHPFYTGKQKLMDTAGRIDRFNKRYNRG